MSAKGVGILLLADQHAHRLTQKSTREAELMWVKQALDLNALKEWRPKL